MEITTGTIALLFDYIELINYMEITTGTIALLSQSFVMVLSLWVYHMVHQKSRNFLLNCYEALLWLQMPL